MKLNLVDYFEVFPDALQEKYGSRFERGFADIDNRFREVSSGSRLLTADDVMAIFDDSLPFAQDWTMPDRQQLQERMAEGIAQLIRDLKGRRDLDLITRILERFGELSITSLVLQHAYPKTFSMCSHHIASLLYIVGHRSAGTVPRYYREYCRELETWGKHFGLNVRDTEFALWTWYRLANYGSKEAREEHRGRFQRDPWVRRRRRTRACESLTLTDKMGFARFCTDTDPTLAGIIAWREFEVRVRALYGNRGIGRKMPDLIAQLPTSQKAACGGLWEKRNSVMHNDLEISETEAGRLVRAVADFLDRHKPKGVLS